MISSVLTACAGGLIGALEWRRLASRHSDLTVETVLRRARHLMSVLPVALALLGAQVYLLARPEALWSAPVWLELHYGTVLFGGLVACFGVLFGLATYGAFATRHPHRLAALAAWVLVTGTVLRIEWDVTRPIADELQDRELAGVVLQTSGHSCAAASAANLARRHGIVRSEREMARLLGTTEYGSTPAQIVDGLAHVGILCRKVERADRDPAAVEAPAILFFEHGVGHAVMLDGVHGDVVEVLDPLSGRQEYRRAELLRAWDGRGVECARPPILKAP